VVPSTSPARASQVWWSLLRHGAARGPPGPRPGIADLRRVRGLPVGMADKVGQEREGGNDGTTEPPNASILERSGVLADARGAGSSRLGTLAKRAPPSRLAAMQSICRSSGLSTGIEGGAQGPTVVHPAAQWRRREGRHRRQPERLHYAGDGRERRMLANPPWHRGPNSEIGSKSRLRRRPSCRRPGGVRIHVSPPRGGLPSG
jgi:hypothetical protein